MDVHHGTHHCLLVELYEGAPLPFLFPYLGTVEERELPGDGIMMLLLVELEVSSLLPSSDCRRGEKREK